VTPSCDDARAAGGASTAAEDAKDAEANSPTAMLAMYLCGGGAASKDKKLFC